MKNFRNSFLAKSLSFILAFCVLFVSCSQEYIAAEQQCSAIGIVDFTDASTKMERALELAYSIHQQDAPTTSEEIFEANGLANIEVETKTQMLQLIESFNKNGFVSTIDAIGGVSDQAKNYLALYTENLEVFLVESNPSLEDFILFQEEKIQSLQSTTLCQEDISVLAYFHHSVIGAAKFFYKFKDIEDFSREGCGNFWQNLLCVLLAAGIFAISIIYAPGYAVGQALSTLLGIGLGITGYERCCRWFETPLPTCGPPTGSLVVPLQGCNNFRYRVFGPSVYGTTTWNPPPVSSNVVYAALVTPTPVVDVSIPLLSLSGGSTLDASITCMSGPTSVTAFPWRENLTFPSTTGVLPTLTWAQSPPSSASPNIIYNISVNGGSLATVVSWSVSPFGGFTQSTSNSSANLKFIKAGDYIVKATVFDPCTNVSTSISKEVQVK